MCLMLVIQESRSEATVTQDGNEQAGQDGQAQPQVASVLQQRIAQGHQATAARVTSSATSGQTDAGQQSINAVRLTAGPSKGRTDLAPAASSSKAEDQPKNTAADSQSSDEDSSADDCDASNSSFDSEGSESGSDVEGLDSQDPFRPADTEADDKAASIEIVSPVTCITADFAMQNVLLQMGLQLQAPNGLRLKRVSRYVQRCSACFFVVKASRSLGCASFCPSPFLFGLVCGAPK